MSKNDHFNLKTYSELARVLEATVPELAEMLEAGGDSLSPIFRAYAKVIYLYLRGTVDDLCKFLLENAPCAESSPLYPVFCLAELRLQIRSRAIQSATMTMLETLAAEKTEWQGESHNVLGNACFDLEDFANAQRHYHAAAVFFKTHQTLKRAVKAELNLLVCRSHLEPQRNFVLEYTELYQKASSPKVRDLRTASTALSNMSREYQTMGAPLAALRCIQKSLRLLKREFGTVPYYLALIQRCHVLLDLGRMVEALTDLGFAKAAPFPEIQSAVIALSRRFETSKPSLESGTIMPSSLSPGWKNRKDLLSSVSLEVKTLSPKEETLLEILSTGPKNKYDLIEALYCDDSSLEAKENRFKNLLAQLRKKRPDWIVCNAGVYYLTTETAHDQRRKA